MTTSTVNVGLLGLGTVGGGTVSVLHKNSEEISRRAGRVIRISHAAAKAYNANSIGGLDQIPTLSDDAWAVVADPEVTIVVELIGGLSPAKELVLAAIKNGKHVVTANKALIAIHGNELFAAARERGVNIAFEAAVAGGIPIIKAMREGLVANRIEWVAGIINGTGNYILTEMYEKGRNFASVLAEAKDLGYAEADPTFDVEGIDAAHKLTIIASLAFGIPLQFDKAHTEGISAITLQDVIYANELGYRIKHLGITRKTEQGIEIRVHPTLIPHRRLIANVNGVMNAVLVKGDVVGTTLYYGAGAGAEATASAVVADVVDTVRDFFADSAHRVPHLAFQPDRMSTLPVLAMDEVMTAYYLRIQAQDKPGVLAEITTILAESAISIEAMVQKETTTTDSDSVPIVFLTHQVCEKNMNVALTKIAALDVVDPDIKRIRVEGLS